MSSAAFSGPVPLAQEHEKVQTPSSAHINICRIEKIQMFSFLILYNFFVSPDPEGLVWPLISQLREAVSRVLPLSLYRRGRSSLINLRQLDMEHGIENMDIEHGHGTLNRVHVHGTWNREHEHGAWNIEHVHLYMKHGI